MNQLSPWVRKLVAVALLASVLALSWGWGIAPLHKGSLAAVEALQEARFEAARMARAVEAAKHVSEARVGELELFVSRHTVAGLSEAEAMTLVQGAVDRLMKDNSLVLESIQSNPSVAVGTMRRLGFNLRAHGSESRVVDFLAAVEQSAPMLRLGTLVLRASAPGGGGEGATVPTLSVEATLFAYWRAPVQGNGK